jgi:Domain of Unknown Function (DUF1206)
VLNSSYRGDLDRDRSDITILALLFAAIHARSSEAKGIAGALRTIQHYPYGWALLGITAAGLIAFGLFQIGEGAYRRITPPRIA